MFSIATLKAFQIYGISIAISMFVAALIKVLVTVASRVNPAAKAAVVSQMVFDPSFEDISGEVIAAIFINNHCCNRSAPHSAYC